MNTLKFGNGEWYGKKDTILAYNDLNSNFKPLPFSFDRASSATRVNKDGLIETVGSGEPRIDYKDDSKGALLLEPTTLNLVPYSEDFSFSSWVGGGSLTVEGGYLAPDGSNNAYKVSGSGGALNTSIGLLQSTTRSIYARTVSGNGKISLLSYFGNSNSLFDVTEEWQRFEVNSAIPTGASSFYAVDFRNPSATLSEVIIWGANATNDQSYATSYIPTQGGVVTRVADVCNNGANEQVINSTEGVLYAEIKGFISQDTTDLNRYITITNGTSNERVALLLGANSNQLRAIIYSSTQSINLSFTTSLTDVKQYNKLAVKYKSGDYAFFLNGTKINSSNITNAFSANTLNDLSFDVGGGTQQFRGKVKGLKLYNTALTDQELINLTTI